MQKSRDKIYQLKLPHELNNKVSQYTTSLNKVDITLPSTDFRLPNMEIPNTGGLTMPGLKDLHKVEIPKIGKMPVGDEINGITEVTEDLKNIQREVPTDFSNPDKVIESKVGEVTEIRALEGIPDAPIMNAENPQEQVKQEAKKAAVDHFSGKQEQLKAAMDKMSKYKQKYSNVQNIKDLTRKPSNEMNDKSFIERLVPGITFQYQFNDNYLLDIYSHVGFRLTTHLTTGLGWNQRLARDKDNNYWNKNASVFGPRAFANYKLGKGFIAHVELETLNTFVSYNRTDPKIGQREWVWSTMTGLKKEYRITKNLKGTILVLYNIIDPRHKSPYNDRLNTRIGFEYRIKKKPKEKVQN